MTGTIGDHVQLLRPAQWVKNVFVFFALMFSDRRGEPEALGQALIAFFSFSLLSSAVYAFNDIRDREEDAQHPTKRNRPLARGAITVAAAGAICAVCLIGGLALSATLPATFMTTVVTYLVLNLFYTLGAKKVPLLDVILVATGFVLRALGGAQAISVEVSAWLVICTFTLCLFLGFGKRRCEIAMINEAGGVATKHRATLAHYTPELLNHLLSTTAMLAVMTFVLYTLDPHTARFRALFFTTPLVLYAVYRYAMVIEGGKRTGPTDILIRDKPFFATCIVWTVLAVLIVNWGPRIERYLPVLRWPGESIRVSATTDSRPSGPNVSD
ncbi:MAG: decaprenyl-phosphate phosphoribosyltransferase [Phycisphaerae bacterium]|nr:decaprenyl-phosphate phosphoribosyltransferase [Phycisphaerae bacterium]NUQ47235.1 decaprenyl-phosphate phosphoribosyltransferase [Phycisphaerae bacterium]